MHNMYVYLPIVSNQPPTNFDSKMIEIKMIQVKIGSEAVPEVKPQYYKIVQRVWRWALP